MKPGFHFSSEASSSQAIFLSFSLLVLTRLFVCLGCFFLNFRRKWGLPGFRKSSQGKLGEAAPAPAHSSSGSSSSGSSATASAGGAVPPAANNKLPPLFRKSQSDKKFKVRLSLSLSLSLSLFDLPSVLFRFVATDSIEPPQPNRLPCLKCEASSSRALVLFFSSSRG